MYSRSCTSYSSYCTRTLFERYEKLYALSDSDRRSQAKTNNPPIRPWASRRYVRRLMPLLVQAFLHALRKLGRSRTRFGFVAFERRKRSDNNVQPACRCSTPVCMNRTNTCIWQANNHIFGCCSSSTNSRSLCPRITLHT